MTYAIRDAVLCDGVPGMICGKTFGTNQYDVLLLSGAVKANVETDRLRPRPVVEVVNAGR